MNDLARLAMAFVPSMLGAGVASLLMWWLMRNERRFMWTLLIGELGMAGAMGWVITVAYRAQSFTSGIVLIFAVMLGTLGLCGAYGMIMVMHEERRRAR